MALSTGMSTGIEVEEAGTFSGVAAEALDFFSVFFSLEASGGMGGVDELSTVAPRATSLVTVASGTTN